MGKNKTYFECMHTTQKNRKCTGMIMVAREDRSEERGGKKRRAARYGWVLVNRGQKNRQRNDTKRKRVRANWRRKLICIAKKQARNEPEKPSKNPTTRWSKVNPTKYTSINVCTTKITNSTWAQAAQNEEVAPPTTCTHQKITNTSNFLHKNN